MFHQKFGMGTVKSADGDKLEIAFDKAGEKKVISRFGAAMNKRWQINIKVLQKDRNIVSARLDLLLMRFQYLNRAGQIL